MNQNIARNPVAKAIEQAYLRKHREKLAGEIKAASGGAVVGGTIADLIETIAMSIKTIEGWDDPDDIGGMMVEAVIALEAMAKDGKRWDDSSTELCLSALDAAVQILSAQDPALKLKAWQLTQQAIASGHAMRARNVNGVQS